MPKSSTNLSIDSNLKRASIELFSDLGLDLSSAVTLFLKQSLRVQGLPFAVTRVNPNAETVSDHVNQPKESSGKITKW